jgi:hypothetical protein
VRDSYRWLGLGGLLFAIAVGSAGTASALPALQLGPGSFGGWSYDASTQTWIASAAPLELAAYANATAAQGGNGAFAWDAAGSGSRLAYLVISAVPQIAFDGFDVTVENDAGVLGVYTSGVGTPPLEDPNDLAPHSIFATYYEIYEFDFDEALGLIGDTQPGGTGSGQGHSEALRITVHSLATGVDAIHMDLFTITDAGKLVLPDDPDVLPNPNIVNRFAPFSHDAQTVPEPSSALLFGVGCLVAGLAARARRER